MPSTHARQCHCVAIHVTPTANAAAYTPECVTFIEFHQYHVSTEMCLVWAQWVIVIGCQVIIELLQCLEALGEIVIINLWVKHGQVLGTQPLGAVYVESGTLLQQADSRRTTQPLLSDVLAMFTHTHMQTNPATTITTEQITRQQHQ